MYLLWKLLHSIGQHCNQTMFQAIQMSCNRRLDVGCSERWRAWTWVRSRSTKCIYCTCLVKSFMYSRTGISTAAKLCFSRTNISHTNSYIHHMICHPRDKIDHLIVPSIFVTLCHVDRDCNDTHMPFHSIRIACDYYTKQADQTIFNCETPPLNCFGIVSKPIVFYHQPTEMDTLEYKDNFATDF
jgi:hypothetical protein